MQRAQTRRVLLVGAPVFFKEITRRVVVALAISVIFQVIHIHYKPYEMTEHNFLAELAIAQITSTLMLINFQLVASTFPATFGFFCIVLNIMIVPLVIWFNARRLKRRKSVLDTFLVQRRISMRRKAHVRPDQATVQRSHLSTAREFFDPTHFSEYWKAGRNSKFEAFSASLKWMDDALIRPVSRDRWGQLLFTLEQLPLTTPAHADVRHGKCGAMHTN